MSFDAGLSVTVRLGETETLEFNRDRVLGLTVYFDHRKGTATTADFEPDSIEATVRAACDVARYTSEDPCAGLADVECLAKEIPDLDLYHPWDLGPEQAIVARPGVRGRRPCGRPVYRQLGRRYRRQLRRVARQGQQPRLPWQLPDQLSQHQLFGNRTAG